MKVDILAIAAHPDDVELACSGTLIKEIKQGKTVAILDLTRGELGSRGTAELRTIEARKSAEIMGISERFQLNLRDGFFENSEKELIQIIEQIRYFQPEIVLANAPSDRHPDHGRASELVRRACFLSGLIKIETNYKGAQQLAHRPKSVFFYIQDRNIGSDFIVDITQEYEQKRASIAAFKSQFYQENSEGPETPISGKEFWDFLEARARDYGRSIGCEFGEGFICEKGVVGVKQLTDLF